MATKPIVQPELWASNAVYTTGPFIGSPGKVVPGGPVAAEGHRPGSAFPTPAEYENSQQNRITDLVRWVFLGSSAGAADAHIVETDSDGITQLEGLVIDPANAAAAALTVNAPPGAGSAISATGGAGFGDPTIVTETTGTGSAFHASSATAGVCISAVAFAAATSAAITVTHAGVTAAAVTIEATGAGAQALALEADNDAALFAEGGIAGSAAVLAVGKSTAVGIRGSGGPGGANGIDGIGTGSAAAGVAGVAEQHGVRGSATDAADGFGVYGTSAAAASSLAGGVHGEGLGAGSGVFGEAVDGYGGLFTADGDRQTIFMTPRITDPTASLTGGFWNRTTRGLSTFVSNVVRLIWHTAGGAAIAWDWDAGPGTVDDGGGAILTCTLTNADSPVIAGTVWILVAVEVGRNSGTPNVEIQAGDSTVPNYYVDDTVQMFQAAGASTFERHLVYVIPYPLPLTGDRTFSVNLASTVAGQNINWRNAGLAVIGVF